MTFPSSPYTFAGAPPASSPTRPSSFFSPGPGAPQVAPASSPAPGLDSAAPMFPNRKRRAPSPPPTGVDPQPSAWSHDTKRRRPNLANGFQAMSISPRPDDEPEPWFPHGAVHDETGSTDDYGLEPTLPPPDGDVAVEELPDQSPTARRRPRMPWHRNSSFSSTSPSDEDYDSDATFRVPPRPAPLVQPSDIEHPPDDPEPTPTPRYHGRHREPLPMPHVEVMETPVKRKGSGGDREAEADGNGAPHSAKRRRQGMDVDMDAMPHSHGPGWYEPEKDRIVITSLSSPEPESPGGSPEPDSPSYSYEQYRKLAQPGSHGFTISPSLLTHILGAQRDQFGMPAMPQPEKGLVLYRPVANPPDPRDPRRQDPRRPFGVSPAENVVQQWDDANRFEEVDDDEDFMSGTPVVGVPVGMDVDMGGGMGYGGGDNEPTDDAMEVE